MHTNPEVLALLALGEHPADPADGAHVAACAQCRAELESLSRLIAGGRAAPESGTLDAPGEAVLEAPSEAVWAAIQAELGFIPVTRSWPDVERSEAAPVNSDPAVDGAGQPIKGRTEDQAEDRTADRTGEPGPRSWWRGLLPLVPFLLLALVVVLLVLGSSPR